MVGVLPMEEEAALVSSGLSLVKTFFSLDFQLLVDFEEVVSLLVLLLVIAVNCTRQSG